MANKISFSVFVLLVLICKPITNAAVLYVEDRQGIRNICKELGTKRKYGRVITGGKRARKRVDIREDKYVKSYELEEVKKILYIYVTEICTVVNDKF